MTTLAICTGCLLLALAAYQAAVAAGFTWALVRHRRELPSDKHLPRVAVLMSLRGADPYLEAGLRSILDQDHPNYEVRIVVDDYGDPAWKLAESAVSAAPPGRARIDVLRQRRETCSLKCSAILQMLESLDGSFAAVVLADADLVPHRQWLRELLAPLADPRVPAAHAQRWYMPGEGRWGSLVRYQWNAGALVPTYYFRYLWGGSLAIRMSVLRELGAERIWRRAVVEDASLYTCLRRRGLHSRFVPSLMMVNREECGITSLFDYILRQCIWTRLYQTQSFWSVVVPHAAITTGAVAAAGGLAAAGLVLGNLTAAAWATAGLLGYQAGMLLLMAMMEFGVRRIVRARGEPSRWLTAGAILRLAVSVPLTQVMHALAVASAIVCRRACWRGVTYELRDRWRVRMLGYQPFGLRGLPCDAQTSV